MALLKFFTGHPASVGETYWQHFAFAFKVFLSLAKAALACLIHAVVPPLFPKTASSEIDNLHVSLETRAAVRSVDDENPVPLGGFKPPLLQGTE